MLNDNKIAYIFCTCINGNFIVLYNLYRSSACFKLIKCIQICHEFLIKLYQNELPVVLQFSLLNTCM